MAYLAERKEARREAIARGEDPTADVPGLEHAQLYMAISLAVGAAILVGLYQAVLAGLQWVVAVVALGAAGLAFRGWGELAKDEKMRPYLKAAGYFMGAAAYAFTAFVALRRGLDL